MEIYDYLKTMTSQYDIEPNDIFTASNISERFKLSRNTISQYLNDFYKQNLIIKINTRPVYFFDKETIEKKWNIILNKTLFDNFNELKAQRNTDFEQLVGYNGSLRNIINQCKAAIAYPDHGLPILIYGPTGTGKTLLANTMYLFAKNKQIINQNSRFVSINCSEYANNPELLTANLFGHVKGAYTSADDNQEGLIALANNGVLFLDEVHSLKAECQEKLFQFMDTGSYHKLGDNDKWYKSNCRLIFATTQDPQAALLKTLLRRIPITVKVPALNTRPLIEKKAIIYSMLAKESNQLNKSIYISNLVYATLIDFDFKGNIGELKNAIKATCANALLHTDDNKLQIRLLDLPPYLFAKMHIIQLNTHNEDNETLFNINALMEDKSTSNPLIRLYKKLLDLWNEHKNDDFEQIIELCSNIIQNHMDSLSFNKEVQHPSAKELYLLKLLDKIYSIVMNKYNFIISNSAIKIYSRFFYEYLKNATETNIWVSSHIKDINEFSDALASHHPRRFNICEEVLQNTALNLDIQTDAFMQIIITIALVHYKAEELNIESSSLILCHGYSTASSIAETCNQLLSQNIFEGIDMELKISKERMIQIVDNYLKKRNKLKELILLVDMGSLEEIYKNISPVSDCNIGIINHVSTALALEVGHMIMAGCNAKSIIDQISDNYKLSANFIESEKKKEAILSLCATGFGAAKKINDLLLKSLPRPIDLEIIPYDHQLIAAHKLDDPIFSSYHVVLIVGTLDPKIESIPFISIENIVTNDQIQLLQKVIGKYLDDEELVEFNQNVMKNFTLSNLVNNLTILNPEKVMEDVTDIVEELEANFDMKLNMTTKIGLYVHISCLIERLILRQGIDHVQGFDQFKETHRDTLEKIDEAFSGVKDRYSVEMPGPELMYILNYFQE